MFSYEHRFRNETDYIHLTMYVCVCVCGSSETASLNRSTRMLCNPIQEWFQYIDYQLAAHFYSLAGTKVDLL